MADTKAIELAFLEREAKREKKLADRKRKKEAAAAAKAAAATSAAEPAKTTSTADGNDHDERRDTMGRSFAKSRGMISSQISALTSKSSWMVVKRERHVSALVKDVVNFLYLNPRKFSEAELTEQTGIDIEGREGLRPLLQTNIKIVYDATDGSYEYRSKFSVRNKDELLQFVRETPHAVSTRDLKDCYPTVLDDVAELEAEGHVFQIEGTKRYNAVFNMHPEFAATRLEEEFVKLWNEVAITDLDDVRSYLDRNSLKVHGKLAAKKKRKARARNKSSKRRRITKLRNIHVKEFLLDENGNPR